MQKLKVFDVAIVGAGPGGCATALALRKSGLRVVILEKAIFPRDKVCGDAIPFETYRTLRELSPELYEMLWQMPSKRLIRANRVVTPNGRSVLLPWRTKAFNSPRLDFDYQLLKMVEQHTETTVFQNFKVKNLTFDTNKIWKIQAENGEQVHARTLVGAGGFNCVVARKVAQNPVEKAHYSGSVRVYVENVEGLEDGVNEIHLFKAFPSAYFWIFPVSETVCNVGFGMLSEDISKKKLNLKTTLEGLLKEEPSLKNRFAGATFLTSIQGSGIPLGTRSVKMAGEGFLLVGDAAALVDPIGGHGIGTAIWSGQLAGKHLEQCFKNEDWSEAAMQGYAAAVELKIGRQLRRNGKIQRFAIRYPSTVNWFSSRWFQHLVNFWVYR